ncbi:MAG: prolipoprotein diacylglyceryl transferase [Clostridiales bacterium]|nr:prolipoprotein diacylglyceryl transferase [Clostridiales bacterium]
MLNIIDGFKIFGLNIKFYGILMALAMLVGVILACKNAKNRSLKSDNIFLLALYILPLAVIGARLFFVLGSESSYTFVEILQIWNGGMSIFGGIIGGVIGVALFCAIHKKNFFNVTDVVVVSLILGQAIGRWGNFFNQEVYGQVITNPSWQWFPFAVYIDATASWHQALFFYEFLLNIGIFVGLFIMLKKVKQKGYVTATYLISYGLIRFLLEPLRMAEYNLMLFGVKLSSLTSAIALAIGVAILVVLIIKSVKSKKMQNIKK